MKAYDEVFRDCQYIHGFTEEDVQKFLDLANVFSGIITTLSQLSSAIKS